MGGTDGAGEACLEVEGAQGPERLPLRSDCVGLGRDPASDLVLADAAASWHHARVLRRAGGFVLEDLGSRNGTWVNGRRLAGPRALADGDRLRLGTVALRFWMAAGRAAPGGGPGLDIRADRRAREVDAITSTPYFRELQRQAARRRARGAGPPAPEGGRAPEG